MFHICGFERRGQEPGSPSGVCDDRRPQVGRTPDTSKGRWPWAAARDHWWRWRRWPPFLALGPDAMAQTAAAPTENAAPTADNAVMLTIFFKHDQSRPLSELNAQLERTGLLQSLPAGRRRSGFLVFVLMGIGQVVTLRLPASRLREVTASWGEYRLGQLPHRILSDYDTRPSAPPRMRRPNSLL